MSDKDNKRIAKNTVALYVRMGISMIVSLYTSRVVLDVLGVVDYGVYSLVGGITALFSFINASMSAASSRYLSVASKNRVENEVKLVFTSSVMIHCIISIIFLTLAETIGLWFVTNRISLPEGYNTTAIIVYQFSVFGVILSILQTPYNAMIIAHEKMTVYAYVEIFNVCLKLGIVYLLLICAGNKLILYSALYFSTSLITVPIYMYYCSTHFKSVHLCRLTNKKYIKPMLSFCGWNLLGDVGYAVRQNGANIILNIFLGPIVNAANGLAMTIQGVVMAMATNVITALRPPIIKEVASGNREYAARMMDSGSVLAFLLVGVIIGPLILNMSTILNIWLEHVPEYTIDFTIICLLAGSIACVSNVLYIGLQADANIKKLNIVRFVIYTISLPVTYYMLVLDMSPNCAYWIILVALIVTSSYNAVVLKKKYTGFGIYNLSFRLCFIVAIGVSIGLLIRNFLNVDNSYVFLIISSMVYMICFSVLTYCFVLNRSEKRIISAFVCSFKGKFLNGKSR